MTSLTSLARTLGGTVVGHQVLCPGPGHSKKDRSLSVVLTASHPDGFIVHSHCGDDPLLAKDHVRSLLGWDRPAWDRRSKPVEIGPRNAALFDGKPVDDTAKIARAVAIWNEAQDPRGTVVERYLTSRDLALPWHAAGEAIRFHPACPWRDEETGKTIRVPAMVAAMRSIATEEITGVHRTRVTTDGVKVDRRMLGIAGGAAVMLCPYSAIGAGIVVGEGIETCIAASMMCWSNVWALCSVGAVAAFPLLPFTQTIILLAETDDGGASERAIQAVGRRWEEAGREVIVVTPRCSGDLNDAIRGRAA